MAQALHGRRIGGAAVVGIQLPCAFGEAIAVLRQAGYPASVSHSAGTFVCNHAFYGLQHALAGQNSVRSGFMHLPYLPEQAARHARARSLALGTMATVWRRRWRSRWRLSRTRRSARERWTEALSLSIACRWRTANDPLLPFGTATPRSAMQRIQSAMAALLTRGLSHIPVIRAPAARPLL